MNKTNTIIFCGVDKCGKSTIIDSLVSQAGMLSYFKFKSSKEKNRHHNKFHDFEYGVEMITQMIEQGNFSVVLDRFHPCEYAYAKALGRYFDEKRVFDIDERMAKLNAKIIYCYKTPKYYLEDKEDVIELDQYDDVKKYYEEFFKKSKCEVFYLCTDDHNLDKQMKEIMAFYGGTKND